MKIAIIAWGSLVWDPRTLQIKGNWDNNGPMLNIEFSRVSKDGRLTLVIDPNNGEEVKTYFAQSKRNDLGDAIADLRDREGTIKKQIGFVDVNSGNDSKAEFPDQIDVFQNIRNWCQSLNFDAAVWTSLPSQFKDQTKLDFSVDNAISYLKDLPKSARENALEYIRKAPKEIVTPVRKIIKEFNYDL
ncbi:MAG: hypothetical protein COA54_09540 [Thiotrichaceae bacterium]|nr:MAG: hypothetical protein COA54_09540 [Thiotrichaceae bacterium]